MMELNLNIATVLWQIKPNITSSSQLRKENGLFIRFNASIIYRT